MGYADQGEEDDWTRPDHSPEHETKGKKPGKTGEKRTGTVPEPAAWSSQKHRQQAELQARRPSPSRTRWTRHRSSASRRCSLRQPSAALPCATTPPPARRATLCWTISWGTWAAQQRPHPRLARQLQGLPTLAAQVLGAGLSATSYSLRRRRLCVRGLSTALPSGQPRSRSQQQGSQRSMPLRCHGPG